MSISSAAEHNHRMILIGQRFFITKHLHGIVFIKIYTYKQGFNSFEFQNKIASYD